MKTTNGVPVHPGEIIKQDILPSLGLSVRAAAKAPGRADRSLKAGRRSPGLRRPGSLDFPFDFPYIVVQMAKADSLGQFEQLVLTAILTLREDAYGVTIHSKVAELARLKPVALGAVYVTLDRLEDKGMIQSWLADPTPERGGRAKRCYRLLALGERALEESAVTAKRIWDGIVQVWGKEWAKQWGKGVAS